MNPKPKYEHLQVYKYKHGQSGNKLGRPKSYVTILKELGYTKPMIATMVAEIMMLNSNDIYKIVDSDTEPMIRKAISKAFCKAVYTGEYKYISDYMTILFGRPVPYIPEIHSPDNENKTIPEEEKPAE